VIFESFSYIIEWRVINTPIISFFLIMTKNPPLVQIRSFAIYLVKILVLAVIYHLAARVGLSMAYVQANTSPVWPPTGIGLAALLIFGYRLRSW
jgi:hypothetical protein